jgi:hypothetical protein
MVNFNNSKPFLVQSWLLVNIGCHCCVYFDFCGEYIYVMHEKCYKTQIVYYKIYRGIYSSF